MPSRRHPVQALALAGPNPPNVYLAIADTLYCVSNTSSKVVATWKAPAPPLQGKQPQKKPVANDTVKADGLSTGPSAADTSVTDSAADSPSSLPATVVGKRKRSQSNASAPQPSIPPAEGVDAKPAAPGSKSSKKNKKSGNEGGGAGSSALKKQPLNYIGHLLFIPSKNVLAVTTLEDKTLRLLNPDTLEVVKEWPLHKRPSAISLMDDGYTILVGDKFGDVYSYKPADEEAEAQGKLLLGHVSLLTTLTSSSSNNGTSERKFVITADRDEHIRVTNYPLTHVIHGFCLAHTAFVSRLLVTADNLLVSGGGDDWLGVWNWKDGELLQQVDVRGVVEELFTGEEMKELVGKMKEYHPQRRRMREDDAMQEEKEDDDETISLAVNEIVEVNVPGRERGKEIVVTLEGVPVLLRYAYGATGKLEYAGSVRTPGPVISLTVHNSTVYLGCDSESGGLISRVDLADPGASLDDFLSGAGFEGPEVGEENAGVVIERLYSVEGFRKGFGGLGDDD
ncbi:hypothetical protein DRE_02626 [Drechslerella stenobrocha 248]|uniref:Uncharacterized protein n=1 Tax=Drechslerella stenobrocha 248 TaxID=1043628 RepID=W7I7G6_9PEZI|nr:hypothetical protein DRE_02626 [Drechslerella stenobrocha 248]